MGPSLGRDFRPRPVHGCLQAIDNTTVICHWYSATERSQSNGPSAHGFGRLEKRICSSQLILVLEQKQTYLRAHMFQQMSLA